MKIAAITRFKHGQMWTLLQKLGWSQTYLSQRTGLGMYVISDCINLKRRPTEEQALAIQRAFGEEGEFFNLEEAWPEDFVGTKTSVTCEQLADIDPRFLVSPAQQLLDKPNVDDAVAFVLETLPDRTRKIIDDHYIKGHTFAKIGKDLGCTGGNASALHRQTLRRLRSPDRKATLCYAFDIVE
jgi:DNA-directed RNA polymerase specialized sigma subunit